MEKFLLKCPYWFKFILINAYGYLLARRRFSGSFKKWFECYKNNLKKSPEEIREEQLELLKKNLINAFENIPYYNRVFKEVGLDPYRIKSVEEIQKLPFLTKEIIRSEFHYLYNTKINRSTYLEHNTSGSTGERLSFYIPKELFYKKDTALMYRNYGMWGIKPMDRRVTIGGRLFTNKPPFWIFNLFENQLLMSSHHLTKETAKSYIAKIKKFKPLFIQGHPSAILILANYMYEYNDYFDFKIKVIFTTGETLFKEDQGFIEKVFRCKVAQSYGAGESCFSAHQVPNEQGYLINYEHGLIELIGDGDLKEAVVTSFQNSVMPFIRYKTNDYVKEIKYTQSKEFKLPILFDEVIGRVDDIIRLSDGKVVLPVTVRMNIKPLLYDGANYQIIQNDYKVFTLYLIDKYKMLDHKSWKKSLFMLFGDDIIIDIIEVDSLITKGGKIRNVISRIKV